MNPELNEYLFGKYFRSRVSKSNSTYLPSEGP